MDFAPLRLCAQTARALDVMHAIEPKEPKLTMYNECLRQVTVGRALKQVVCTVLYSQPIYADFASVSNDHLGSFVYTHSVLYFLATRIVCDRCG